MSSPARRTAAAYAMDSLKRSMRWDEEAFGREYDLDIFMIVAVSDFNMGAMENKGLNIFNDKYVLASPETATDSDFVSIEAIIAHEYFHNWTGNRITCRDWFQLCLKEGLTVFRDQEFTSDERSRVGEAHRRRARPARASVRRGRRPPRPSGAAGGLSRDQQLLHGDRLREGRRGRAHAARRCSAPETFRKGMDLYFERHDGEAATVEQFVAVLRRRRAAATSTQFMRWYAQAGTPEVAVTGRYDAGAKTYRLDLAQIDAADAGPADQGADGRSRSRIGLVGRDGRDLPLTLADGADRRARRASCSTSRRRRFTFTGVAERPVLSINRGFSAPVKLDRQSHAPTTCGCWRRATAIRSTAGRRCRRSRRRLLVGNVARLRAGQDPEVDEGLLDALAAILADRALEPAFVAEALAPPSEADIAREIGRDVDPDAIFRARTALRALIGPASRRRADRQPMSAWPTAGPTARTPPAPDGARCKNVCLDLLAATQESHAIRAARPTQYQAADNMTDRMAALATLIAARRAGARGRARRLLRALPRAIR